MIAIVLAGGVARRMGGGDKGLLELGGRPILARVLDALEEQCDSVLINANDDPGRFAAFGKPVLPDTLPGRPGPLAGVLAGLAHAATSDPDEAFVLTVPADAPFLPRDLVARLGDRRVADRAAVVRARSNGRTHGVVALWAVALRDDLGRFLAGGGRAVDAFADCHPVATVDWPREPFDPFLNVNTPEDLAAAERIATLRPLR